METTEVKPQVITITIQPDADNKVDIEVKASFPFSLKKPSNEVEETVQIMLGALSLRGTMHVTSKA